MKTLEMSQTDRNIMNNINKYMDLKSVMGKELAEVLDTSPGAISRFRNGLCTPNSEQLVKLADYFGITLPELFGSEDNSIILSSHEAKVVRSLRDHPEYSDVIDKILDIKK